MHGYRVVPIVVCLAAVISCGGENPNGGGRQTIPQNSCRVLESPGWETEVHNYSPPVRMGYCPMVVPDLTIIGGSLIVDVWGTEHGGTDGWQGNAQLWQLNLALDAAGNPGPPIQAINQNFFFDSHAPYTTINPRGQQEQPVRGQITMAWPAGGLPSRDSNEVDSLDVRYPTNNSYPNSFAGTLAAASVIRTPVVRSSLPGEICCSLSAEAGSQTFWRVKTDWDTLGYRYRWYIDGAHVTGDTAASIRRTFTSLGNHTLRVDQILADGTILTTTQNVNVPMRVSLAGPNTVYPDEWNTWTANVPYGTPWFSYQWWLDGQIVATGPTYGVSFSDPGYTHDLTVEAWDANGFYAWQQIGVMVSTCPPGEPGCMESFKLPDGVKGRSQPSRPPNRRP